MLLLKHSVLANIARLKPLEFFFDPRHYIPLFLHLQHKIVVLPLHLTQVPLVRLYLLHKRTVSVFKSLRLHLPANRILLQQIYPVLLLSNFRFFVLYVSGILKLLNLVSGQNQSRVHIPNQLLLLSALVYAELERRLQFLIFTYQLLANRLLVLVLVIRLNQQNFELLLKPIHRTLVFLLFGVDYPLELFVRLLVLFPLALLKQLDLLPVDILQLPCFVFKHACPLGILLH